MKFFLPILLAAPAVMGRACKVRHSHSSAVEAVHTQYPVPEPVISQAPQVVGQKSSPVEVKTAASKPKTTKSKTSKPKKVSKPKASKPKASKPKSTTTTKPSTPKTSTPSTGSSSKSTPLGDGASLSGSSTFYGGNLAGGNCMFSTYTLPSGILGTAFSGQKWDNSANCGACIEVTGRSGTIKAMVRPSTLILSTKLTPSDRRQVPRM